MELDGIIGIVLRWMHILAAITAVGGTIFARLALLPAMDVLNEADRGNLQEAVRQRWARPVQISIAFLLISGIINTILIMNQYDVSRVRYYHPVFGIKFLLAFVVFFLASALTGHGKATQRFRDNRRYWLTVNMIVAILIVCLSGILRRSDPPRKPAFSSLPANSAVLLASPADFLPNELRPITL